MITLEHKGTKVKLAFSHYMDGGAIAMRLFTIVPKEKVDQEEQLEDPE